MRVEDLTDQQLDACVAAVLKIIAVEERGKKPRGYNAEQKLELIAGPMVGFTVEELHSPLFKIRGALRRLGHHSEHIGATTGIDALTARVAQLRP